METISSLPWLDTSQTQPLPNRPTPAASNLALKSSKLPNAALMSSRELAGRRAAGVRAEDFPEEGVVPMAAAVVAHRAAHGVGHHAEIAR